MYWDAAFYWELCGGGGRCADTIWTSQIPIMPLGSPLGSGKYDIPFPAASENEHIVRKPESLEAIEIQRNYGAMGTCAPRWRSVSSAPSSPLRGDDYKESNSGNLYVVRLEI